MHKQTQALEAQHTVQLSSADGAGGGHGALGVQLAQPLGVDPRLEALAERVEHGRFEQVVAADDGEEARPVLLGVRQVGLLVAQQPVLRESQQ